MKIANPMMWNTFLPWASEYGLMMVFMIPKTIKGRVYPEREKRGQSSLGKREVRK